MQVSVFRVICMTVKNDYTWTMTVKLEVRAELTEATSFEVASLRENDVETRQYSKGC